MKEYYAATREFKVNGVKHKMKQFTLGLQADIEDDDITVRYVDVVAQCTDMNKADIRELHEDQLLAIFNDIQAFTNGGAEESEETEEDGEPKKHLPSSQS